MMRITFLTILFFLTKPALAQVFEVRDGLAYDAQNRLINNTVKVFYDNGVIKEEISYQQGRKEGEYVLYSKSGRVLERGFFENGQKHGKWMQWNEDGLLTGDIKFVYGNKDGRWRLYDDNGTLRYLMFYQNGIKVGTWQMFDENGILAQEQTQAVPL
jgi:antitoxin component YwqK of YwqJK toxin-antitoxin module